MKSFSKATIAFTVIATLLSSQLLAISSASAADKGWRYWGYFQAAPDSTQWTAAMTGPTVDIKDGAVEGWSFVFSSDDLPSKAPSAKTNFASICGKTKAKAGMKRIGLVIDFGGASYAPKGEKPKKLISTCVTTALDSQGIDVLGQALKVRSDGSGLICGLNGYPKKECGVELKTPAALLKK
ncbi:hypothetical protein MCEMRE203_00750 [Candidatus Nanopelagicaceae bacterium]